MIILKFQGDLCCGRLLQISRAAGAGGCGEAIQRFQR
jgi:hypothetical protein